MDNKYSSHKKLHVIDRFEEKFAVLEDAATLETMSILREELPKEARTGDTLEFIDGVWHLNHRETNMRKQRIDALWAKIKNPSG